MGKKYRKLLAKLKDANWGIGRLALMDEEMVRVIVAWPHAKRTIAKDSSVPSAKSAWDFVSADMIDLADLSQMQSSRLKKVLHRLRRLKLIFPDGTVPDEVDMFVRAEVAKKIGIKPGKKKPSVQPSKKELIDE